MWKGGRLKLEKAKEHYLLRLKREWDDDAKLINSAPSRVDISDSKPSSEKPKKLQASEKPNIRIFFPKLSKVNSLCFLCRQALEHLPPNTITLYSIIMQVIV